MCDQLTVRRDLPETLTTAMERSHRHPLMTWLIRFLGWDGLVPAAIWLLPFAVRLLVPKIPLLIEVMAVILPIVAFFLRFKVGVWHISMNRCGRIVRSGQFVALCCAILVLALVDAVIILTNVMPKGALTRSDLVFLGYIYVFYLSCMIFALYPGLTNSPKPPHEYCEQKSHATGPRVKVFSQWMNLNRSSRPAAGERRPTEIRLPTY